MTLIGAVGGKKRNRPVMTPPRGRFEHFEVAFLLIPSRNVRATFHGNMSFQMGVRGLISVDLGVLDMKKFQSLCCL